MSTGDGGLSRRIAVVTPFLGKRSGTERCLAEQVERLAGAHGYEVHVYSERIHDLPIDDEGVVTARRGRIVWHRVPRSMGPNLPRYVWWLIANHVVRWRDRRRGATYDAIYSAGVNCIDADVISVHIVFREFFERVSRHLMLADHPAVTWARLLQRRVYYRLLIALERLVYGARGPRLIAVSRKTAADLVRWYRPRREVSVSYHGVDDRFTPEGRLALRRQARAALGLSDNAFAVLFIGNDWTTKGLPTLLRAAAAAEVPHLRLLVVGRDDTTLFEGLLRASPLRGCVTFLPTRGDVEFYYAAADCYVGPSLEDAFGLPPAEAMACGLPVIVSSRAGMTELVTDGFDALVLRDPYDTAELAGLLRRVVSDVPLRHRLGVQAAETLRRYTWDRNAAELEAIIRDAVQGKVVA